MKRTIGIMGNISAGKTTLCKLIEKRWDFVFYPEEVDELVPFFDQCVTKGMPVGM